MNYILRIKNYMNYELYTKLTIIANAQIYVRRSL